jgi:hypothetical protein
MYNNRGASSVGGYFTLFAKPPSRLVLGLFSARSRLVQQPPSSLTPFIFLIFVLVFFSATSLYVRQNICPAAYRHRLLESRLYLLNFVKPRSALKLICVFATDPINIELTLMIRLSIPVPSCFSRLFLVTAPQTTSTLLRIHSALSDLRLV